MANSRLQMQHNRHEGISFEIQDEFLVAKVPPGPKGDPGSDFILLGDTPSDYAGRAGDLPVVNEAEDALEFRELGAVANFILLGDTPSSYAGRAGDLPVVNEAEDALEFRELGAAAKTMKVKTAAQLSGTDYLLGHDAGTPAGMRATLAALATFFRDDIMTTATNSNGTWVRFSNGIQLCFITGRTWTTDANGNNSWSYPLSFNANAAFFGQSHSADYNIREFASASTAGSARVKAVDPAGNNYSNLSVSANLFAIGTWTP